MKKVEKLLITFVTWIYVSILSGLILGALFGGRGGIYFVILGLSIGCVGGVIRTVYLGFTYKPNPAAQLSSKTRVITRRVFFGVLYIFLIYTILSEIFNPVRW